jgi:predicted permease
MRRLRWLVSKLRALGDRRARERDLDAELEFHLEADADEYAAQGVPIDHARRVARRRFGNVAIAREDARAVWTWEPAETLLQDIRIGLRGLIRQRAFTITALTTIILIVGATTAVFALVNSVLLRPLPYPESDRIVFVRADDPEGWTSLRLAEVEQLRTALTSLERWGLYQPGHTLALAGGADGPLHVQDMRITPELFRLLGLRVVLGRPLSAEDANEGSPDVAVIGHDLWMTRFGGKSDVIGHTLELRRNQMTTIVGVAEPGADVPANWLSYPVIWSPIRRSEHAESRFSVLARVRAGRSLASARAQLAALPLFPDPETGIGRPIRATPLLDHLAGDHGRALWIFFGAVSCVLLIGVANLVSLQLVRNASRDREFGIRAALGAGRWRLVRQLLVESLLLGAAGGLTGLLAASTVVGLVVSALPPRFPRHEEIAVDGAVWMFAALLSVAVAIAIGVLPAHRAVRAGLSARLSEHTRSTTASPRRTRLQRTLIAGQTALALLLLVGAGLLVHSLGRLLTEDAGMRESGLWVVRGTVPNRFTGPQAREFWSTALRHVRELPDVERATLVLNDSGPLGGGDISIGGIKAEDRPGSGAGGFSLSTRSVGSDYFGTLGIPIIVGRQILDSDTRTSEPVVVLNRAATVALWPGEEALGKRIALGNRMIRVVGIVPDFKLTSLDGQVSLQMYTPIGQLPASAQTSAILVRAKPSARNIADQANALIRNLERDMTWVDVSTLAQVRWRLVAPERFRTAVLVAFAGTATFLALVGIFGLVSYTVTERFREVGLRLALGSTSARVVSLMARQALLPATIGITLGFVAAIVAGRLLSAFLFEIRPTDPGTLAAVIVLFTGLAAVASLVPALRCRRVNPSDVLRHE